MEIKKMNLSQFGVVGERNTAVVPLDSAWSIAGYDFILFTWKDKPVALVSAVLESNEAGSIYINPGQANEVEKPFEDDPTVAIHFGSAKPIPLDAKEVVANLSPLGLEAALKLVNEAGK